jgi:hypothetical protein
MASPEFGSIVIESPEDAARAIEVFGGYRKLLSWLVLHVAGVPALPGLVIARWDAATSRRIQRFAGGFESGELLLRSDSPAETGRAPRGGYLLASSNLRQEVRRLLDEGRVVFLLEPASPFDDLYSLTLEPGADWTRWEIEVVGPGFDASDLKRGDVTPHEQIDTGLEDHRVVVRHRVVASTQVQRAVRDIRFVKVAASLRCEVADVEEELRQRGETMLVDFPRYPQLPDGLVAAAVAHAVRLRPELARRGLADQGVSVSMSFIGVGGRPVFWDIVWPDSKYIVGDA